MKIIEGAPKSNTYEIGGLEREDIDIIHGKALDVIRERAIKETEFEEESSYGREIVARDREYVERLKAKISNGMNERIRELNKIATIFEALVLEQGEMSEWFGGSAFTIGASEYDDLANGVDMIVEFREEDTSSYLGLAADVTFSNGNEASEGVVKKFDRLIDKVEQGNLPRVKYFYSEHSPVKGQLRDLPEVIIGVDKQTVLELAELWVAGQKKILGQHRVQVMILEQIQAQIIFFRDYAENIGQAKIAQVYGKRLESINEILKEKVDIVRASKLGGKTDRIHGHIMEFIKRRQAGLGSKDAEAGLEDFEE